MCYKNINSKLREIYKKISEENDIPDLKQYKETLENISQQLNFEFGALHVPVFKELDAPTSTRHTELCLASYITWGGDYIDKPVHVVDKETTVYCGHTSFSFDRLEKLWIVSEVRDELLHISIKNDYRNKWNGSTANISELPKYGERSRGDDRPKDKKTSVIIPIGFRKLFNAYVDESQREHRLAVAVFESSEQKNNPTEEEQRIFELFSRLMFELYRKHLNSCLLSKANSFYENY